MSKVNLLTTLFLSVFMFFSFMAPCNAEEIDIPLTVHEALRQGIMGIDREQEPVTIGMPFPKGALYEKNSMPQIALQGTQEYQFRTLKKWHDGSVQWVLIDFQADVKSDGKNNNVHVIRGNGNSAGKLAEDNDEMITVNTGVMVVQIRKKGFNLFDNVSVDGSEIIAKGKSRGCIVTGKEREEYLAFNDAKARVLIEENGPVRAVVKAEGTHIEKDKRMMDYTVRMHFYKGKHRAKVFYTLRNASKEQVKHAYIRSLDLSAKINLSGETYGVVSKHNGTVKESIKEESIILYQAVSDFPQEHGGNAFYYHAPIPPDYKREKKRGFAQEGYWIKKGDKELIIGEKKEYPDLMFLDVSDSQGKGVTVGVRFAAGLWPKSLRAHPDGTIEVGLWPGENEAGYWIRYGSHTTFEIMYDFHVKQSAPMASMKKFQYPLVAKAPVDWYNQSVNGIYPLYNFVSFKDESNFVDDRGWEYKVGWRKPKMKIWRYYYWGWGGFLNQHDFARISLVNFLRKTEDTLKAGEYFLYSEARFNYNADWALSHSDDYDSTQFHYQPEEDKEKVALAKVVFEIEHMHWYGLPLYYYLTGDERIKDAILDWSETIKNWAEKKFILVYERFFGWEMYSLAAMYEFTGDSSFMDSADEIFQRLLSTTFNKQNPWSYIYIDWDRGFIMRGVNKLRPFMTGYIIFDGIYNYYLNMDEKNPLKEKAADVLEGISEFMYREPYFEGTKNRDNHWAFWLPYIYDTKDKSKSKHDYKLILEAFYVNLSPYFLNGGTKWLERMDKIIREAAWDEAGNWDSFGYMDHPGLQAMLYHRLHARKDNSPPYPVADLSAHAKGKDVILSWTVPSDTVRYQIKYSQKRLVESLEYDVEKKSYLYNPLEYANWWAGENISNEPSPGDPGTKQTMTINGLKPGRYYFAIRSWDASHNRSGISNVVEVVVN